MSSAAREIEPDRIGSMPTIALSSVVFPTALRPITATIWFASTERFTPRSTDRAPYETARSVTRSIAAALSPEIDIPDPGMRLDLRHRALGKHATFMHHGDLVGDA